MFRVLVIAAVAALACSCVTGSRSCAHADETTYRCMPLIANTKGCVGGPRGGDQIYPIGCQVDVPECSELDPAIPRTLECVISPDGSPDWYEPI